MLVAVGVTGAAAGGVFILLGIPLVVYAVVRGFRISLVADDTEIRVRNYFRSHRLRWSDIEEIGIGLHQMGGVLSDAIYFQRKESRLLVTAQATMLNAVDRERLLGELGQLQPGVRVQHST